MPLRHPASQPDPRPDNVVTPLIGNGKSHTTDPLARRVMVYVHAPEGGPQRARPTVNGGAVRGPGEYVFDSPDGFTVPSMVVTTNAGNNDVVIVEEF